MTSTGYQYNIVTYGTELNSARLTDLNRTVWHSIWQSLIVSLAPSFYFIVMYCWPALAGVMARVSPLPGGK